jgi:hypothetical protein
MPEIMKLVIAWTCVGVFIATAIITLLALVGIIRLAEKKYLSRLFTLLVSEIVVVSVSFFASWLQAPDKVQAEIETQTSERVSVETVKAVTERFAPIMAEYRDYVARDASVPPVERLEKQKRATELQTIDPKLLIKIRPPVTKGR